MSPKLLGRVGSFTILALVVIAASLGYGVYQKASQQTASSQQVLSPTPTPNAPPPVAEITREYPSNYSDEEKEVLRPVPQGAPLPAQERFFELARKLAIDTNTITIKDCLTTPVVIKAKVRETVTFRDLDGVEHRIRIDEEHQFTVPANRRVQVKLDLIHGPGAHGVSCDDNYGLAGVVLLEPEEGFEPTPPGAHTPTPAPAQ